MELRRALLLFAIVLGMAAIATSVSNEPKRTQPDAGTTPAPRATPPVAKPRETGDPPEEVFFSAADPHVRRLAAGSSATVRVAVAKPGQVKLEGLGLVAPADPITPARFDVLGTRPGVHGVRFLPADGGESEDAGTLRIVR